ncbi:DNA repair protein RecO [Novosphingobium kaempferiae]|uniref:DNA repair protein RecO n=1 Tax=Novosphingobium kaempferiae TaxID=2896849 RepID=UPI001E640649|nr:recombination protein O N-terminal domain-containing protein [Novosphingobium kaempferiae]
MHFRASALVCAALPHGETAVIARLLTAEHGLVAAFVAGGRGRELRPVLIPGNTVEADVRSKSETQLPFARIELLQSRAPWITEPLPAAAIGWVTALAASVLPERQPFPALFEALSGLLEAICVAPSARGWAMGLLRYEVLVLRELGYGARIRRPPEGDWPALLDTFDAIGRELGRYPLADRRRDVMAARTLLRERLARIGS